MLICLWFRPPDAEATGNNYSIIINGWRIGKYSNQGKGRADDVQFAQE